MQVAAVILAAGEGRRFGGPKALAREGERTWLEIALAALARAGLGWASIVVGAAADEVMASGVRPAFAPSPRVSWVRNEAWRAGRTGSLVRGLADLPDWAEAALAHQVDFPHVAVDTMRRLAAACAEDVARAEHLFVPVQSGRRGHPIVIGRAVWPEIAALPPDDPLHLVIRRAPARVIEVAVDDAGIHDNVNRPAAPEDAPESPESAGTQREEGRWRSSRT